MSVQKCPICEGHGNVMGGFYQTVPGVITTTSTNVAEVCRACRGSGVIYVSEVTKR